MNQEFQPPQGYELDKENSTDEKIIYKKKENQYPLSVDDVLGRYYCIHDDRVLDKYYIPKYRSKKSDLSTKERAEVFLALMQLVELRDAWNEIDGFKADWTNNSQAKYGIGNYNNDIHDDVYWQANRIIYFGSPKTRDLFLKTFRDLIETAKELL